MHWISRVGSISKWLPHWIYHTINTYIFHKQLSFACEETFQVLLRFAYSIEILSMCYSIVRLRNRSPSKMRNSSFCFLFNFFPSFLSKLYYTMMTLYDKLWRWFYNKHTALISVHELDQLRITGAATDDQDDSEDSHPLLHTPFSNDNPFKYFSVTASLGCKCLLCLSLSGLIERLITTSIVSE